MVPDPSTVVAGSSMHGIENTHDCYSLQRRVQCMHGCAAAPKAYTYVRYHIHGNMCMHGSRGHRAARDECMSVRVWPSALLVHASKNYTFAVVDGSGTSPAA